MEMEMEMERYDCHLMNQMDGWMDGCAAYRTRVDGAP